MKKIILIVSVIFLFGCESPLTVSQTVPDQCLRAQLFRECLSLVPAGPQSTQYNDWREVINECADAAYYQSLRKKDQVKPECRTE
jgi:hypothetical protein